MANITKGIDVSEHQRSIDYAKVKADDISFVIIRSSLGFSTVDKFFTQNVENAKKTGIPIVGIYHFSYALVKEDAVEEAKFAIDLAKKAGLPKTTIIFYDLEYDNVDRYAKSKTNHLGKAVTIGKTKASEFAKAFCEEVKKSGYVPGIYANTDYLGRMFTSALIDKYVFWHADYRKGAKPDDRATFFQFTSEGIVDGINGKVDINEQLKAVETSAPSEPEKPVAKKSNEEIANEVIEGKWGNGDERKKKLEAAGYDYSAVQKIVNEKMKPATPKKTNEELANEVLKGLWGNGDARKKKLTDAGYDYNAVQKIVNEKLKSNASIISNGKPVSPAQSMDKSLAGTYTVNVDALNMRYIPNKLTSDNVIRVLKRGEKVQNYGYYTSFGNSKWLLIQVGNLTGWVAAGYLKR